jgi:hypothetical protein
MKNKVFSTKAEDYLQNYMNIYLTDLNNKIIIDAPSELSFFNDENSQFLNQKLLDFIEKYNIKEN